jgi:ABC-type proline/glycine betaine transport system substrate-binding protein
LLGDDSTLIRKPPDDDEYVGKIDPRLKAILCDPTNGAWYIALFVTRLENWASTFFDLQRLQDEGVLSPGGSRGLTTNKKEAEAISKYINDKVKLESRFTPQILLLRMYAGASSIKGMANNLKNGHTDKSLNNLLKNIKTVESMTV